MSDEFQEQCFRAALHTLSLDPRQILQDTTRMPVNVDRNNSTTARPTWIGRDYRQGGVLLLGKNPGGGSTIFEKVRPVYDVDFFNALWALREKRDFASYERWRDQAQPAAMIQWRIWTSIHKILETLKLDLHSVAFGNLVPFRTRGNSVRMSEFRNAWDLELRPVIDLVQPALIVKMTSAFAEFQRNCPSGVVVQQFRRANGDRYITDAGRKDPELLIHWRRSICT